MHYKDMKKSLKYIILLVIISVTLQSCFVAKNYSRPENIVSEQNFRTDLIPTDSLSMANLSWKEIFTDQYLVQHIEQGLNNNLDIRIALQNIEASEAYLKMGKAGYFPVINGNASYTRTTQSLNSISGLALNERQYHNQLDLSGNLSWEIDVWGKIRSNQRAYGASYLQSVSAHQAVKSSLVAMIASTYYQLLALDEQRKIAQETITNREQSVETIKLLKEAGTVSEVAVKQYEAQLYNAQSLLIDVENSIQLLENTFSILLGEDPKTIERSSLALQSIDVPLNIGLPIELISNRPDVMAAEYGLINAFELTNVARSAFYPSLKIGANGGVQSLEFDDLFSANSLFGSLVGSLTQPILNGRQIRTQFEVRKAQQESALLNYKKTILIASKEVSDALYTYQANENKIAIKQKEYEALAAAMEYSQELQIHGLANYLEVLTAQTSALNTQLSLVNAEFAKLNAVVQLYKALGGGWR